MEGWPLPDGSALTHGCRCAVERGGGEEEKGKEEEEEEFIQNRAHARGAIANEFGPTRCRATPQEEKEDAQGSLSERSSRSAE